jgi:galactose mutarotase-like enzyme
VGKLSAEWREVHWSESEGPAHGHASNAHWELVEQSASGITLQVTYPEQHPVRRLRRGIRPRPSEPGLDLELEIEARANVRLPVGLHPVFRLSGRTRGTHLKPGAFQFGLTFPGDFEPGADLLAPGATFSSLQAVPTACDNAIDLLRLPLERKWENLVQLCGMDGSFELYHEEEDYHVRLEWDARQLPSCVLWISNRGRADFPWNGRHVALGVEPINSAFDLGTNVSNAGNPIRQRGISTSLELAADQIWSTTYALTAY